MEIAFYNDIANGYQYLAQTVEIIVDHYHDCDSRRGGRGSGCDCGARRPEGRKEKRDVWKGVPNNELHKYKIYNLPSEDGGHPSHLSRALLTLGGPTRHEKAALELAFIDAFRKVENSRW